MEPTFYGVVLCLFISLYSSVSMIVVCVFLCVTYNEVRIPYAINLSDRTSTSYIDATFVVVDLQTAGYIYVRFIPTQISHACFIICRFRWPCRLKCRSTAFDCWDRGFESRLGHGCSSLVYFV